MKKRKSGLFKKVAMASLLALPLSYFSCRKSEMSPFLTKLPDGRVRIEYEKLVDKPFDMFVDGDPIFWTNSKYQYVSDKEGHFFQKTNFLGGNAKTGPSMNPNDGIPEAFVVPVYKGNAIYSDNYVKPEERRHSFVAYLFFDKDYMNAIHKNQKLYFLGSDGEMALLKKLKFSKDHGIFSAKINSEDFLSPYCPTRENNASGRCIAENLRYSLKKNVKDMNFKSGRAHSQFPMFIAGDLGEGLLVPSNLNNPLYSIFGMYDLEAQRNQLLNPLEDARAVKKKLAEQEVIKQKTDELVKRCFDGTFRNNLLDSLRQLPREMAFKMVFPQEYHGCFYPSITELPDNLAEMSILSKNENFGVMLKLGPKNEKEFALESASGISPEAYLSLKQSYEQGLKLAAENKPLVDQKIKEVLLEIAEHRRHEEVRKSIPASEQEALSNVVSMRNKLSIFYGDHEGKYPERLENLVPKYLSEIPSIQVAGHGKTTHITLSNAVLNSTEDIAKFITDSGDWIYFSNPDSHYGGVMINCSHRGITGKPLYDY